MDPDRDALVAQLRRALERGPALRLAVLFGSAAQGRLRPDSDVDLAILPRDPALGVEADLDLQVDLSRACGRPVDLVRLDHADTLLAWEVARHGIVVSADPPEEFARFVARAASEYLDAAPALLCAARTYALRLLEAR